MTTTLKHDVLVPSEFSVDWPYKMQCPACGYDYQHHGNVAVFIRQDGEDGRTFVLYPGSGKVWPLEDDENPSPRRDALRLDFECEAGCRWHLDIIQHKGQTFLRPTIDRRGE